MDQSTYGRTAGIIGQVTNPQELMGMLKNPSYAGFTNVIIARLTEINQMHQSQQASAPQPPTVAQQAIQGAQTSAAAAIPQATQAMASGGIVAFKHGGEVRRFANEGLAVNLAGLSTADQKTAAMLPAAQQAQFVAAKHNEATRLAAQPQPTYLSGIGGVDPTRMAVNAPAAPAKPPVVGQSTQATQHTGSATTDISAGTAPPPGWAPEAPATSGSTGSSLSLGIKGVNANDPKVQEAIKKQQLDAQTAIDAAATKRETDYDAAVTNKFKPHPSALAAQPSADESKTANLWTGLMRAGLGMAQDASSNHGQGILGSMAAGAEAGLEQFSTSQQQSAAARDKALERDIQQEGIMRLENKDRYNTLNAARSSDVQANERLQARHETDATNIQIANAANSNHILASQIASGAKATTQEAADKHAYAMWLGQQDGFKKPYAYYENQASLERKGITGRNDVATAKLLEDQDKQDVHNGVYPTMAAAANARNVAKQNAATFGH